MTSKSVHRTFYQPEMYNAPEGEQLKLNFTMIVQNIANVAKQLNSWCGSIVFLRAKGNPGLVYFASFVKRVIANRDIMEIINSANPCP